MFKGEPGTRKSTAALSFPTPQYWFSWDWKMEAMLLPMKNFKMKPEDIQYDDYKDWNSARAKLEDEQFQLNCPFKTIVIDSVTSCANYILRQTKQAKTGVSRASGKGQSAVGGIAINELEDYNAESAALLELIALTKNVAKYSKVNIILIAHIIQAEYKQAGGATHMSRTIVTAGKRIAPQIPAYCSEVYHFNVAKSLIEGQGGDYELLTTHTGDDFARTGLPIASKITIGNDPLYGRYIEPAIKKLNDSVKPEVPLTQIK
jgi:hypothetical protein